MLLRVASGLQKQIQKSCNMEDLYKQLDIDRNASHSQVKQAYQKLALIYHPDKNVKNENAELSEKFVKIDKAWKILGDMESRKMYDAKWKQREMAQEWPIQEDVHIEEFEEEEEEQCYWTECRCSGQYILRQLDVDIKVNFALCNSCSLCIRVLYG